MHFKYTPLTSGETVVPTKAAGAGKGNGFKPLRDDIAQEVVDAGGNLGLLTGNPSGVVVVDLDPRNFTDGDDLNAVIDRLELVSTRTVETPRGGIHYYYTAPDDILSMTSRPNAFGPGVDFKGDRGYVCAAGTVREGVGRYVTTWDVEPAPMPEHLVRVLRDKLLASRAKKADRYEARANAPEKVTDPPACCRKVAGEAAFEVYAAMDELRNLPEGGRNDEDWGWDDGFWRYAAKLVEIAEWPWTRYSVERAHQAFLDHAPDSADFDADHKWLNGYENAGTFYEGEQHRLTDHVVLLGTDGSVVDPKDLAPEAVVAADGPGAPGATQYPLLDLQALLDPERPPREWFLEDVVPRGDAVAIIAPGGVGKSLLALALAVSAVRGDSEFAGKKISQPNKILYVDMENSEDDWAERLHDLGVTQENVQELSGRFLPLSLPMLRGLDTPIGASQLVSILDAYGIAAGDVLVLDSMQRVTEGPENDNDTIRNLYNFTSSELKRRGITVIRTDNTGWEESRVRGSSGKRDDVGYSWLLEPQGESAFALTNSKRRSSGNSGDQIRFTREMIDGVLRFLPMLEAPVDFDDMQQMLDFKAAAVSVLRDYYLGALKEGTDPKMRAAALFSAARKIVPVQRQKGYAWIGELVETREVEVTGGDAKFDSDGNETGTTPKFYTWQSVPDDVVSKDDGQEAY